MFVLDTNVVSELRKIGAGKADPHVARWADSVDAATLHLSAITILELELGILQMERRDPRQAALLRTWLETRVLPEFDGRIFPVDTIVAQRCARRNPQPNRTAVLLSICHLPLGLPRLCC
ncbi:MAG: PIN domain-containing protein [Aliidongia sp.]